MSLRQSIVQERMVKTFSLTNSYGALSLMSLLFAFYFYLFSFHPRDEKPNRKAMKTLDDSLTTKALRIDLFQNKINHLTLNLYPFNT